MTEKKFVYCSALFLFALFCIMLACMSYVGETSKITLAIGSFVVGWYGSRIYERIKDVVRNNKRYSYEKNRQGKSWRFYYV